MGIFNDIEKYQNRPAIISGGKEISYETLTEHTEKIAKLNGVKRLEADALFFLCVVIYIQHWQVTYLSFRTILYL